MFVTWVHLSRPIMDVSMIEPTGSSCNHGDENKTIETADSNNVLNSTAIDSSPILSSSRITDKSQLADQPHKPKSECFKKPSLSLLLLKDNNCWGVPTSGTTFSVGTPPAVCVGTPELPAHMARNPFDSALRDRLHMPVYSPGVFAPTASRSDTDLRMSIDTISMLMPADIDEMPVQEDTFSFSNPVMEEETQRAISAFFDSEHSLMPSPWTHSRAFSANRYQHVTNSSPQNSPLQSFNWRSHVAPGVDAGCQTNLTIPPLLDLTSLLGPQFFLDKQTAGYGQQDLSSRRKLFMGSSGSPAVGGSPYPPSCTPGTSKPPVCTPGSGSHLSSSPIGYATPVSKHPTPQRSSFGGNFDSPGVSPIMSAEKRKYSFNVEKLSPDGGVCPFPDKLSPIAKGDPGATLQLSFQGPATDNIIETPTKHGALYRNRSAVDFSATQEVNSGSNLSSLSFIDDFRTSFESGSPARSNLTVAFESTALEGVPKGGQTTGGSGGRVAAITSNLSDGRQGPTGDLSEGGKGLTSNLSDGGRPLSGTLSDGFGDSGLGCSALLGDYRPPAQGKGPNRSLYASGIKLTSDDRSKVFITDGEDVPIENLTD